MTNLTTKPLLITLATLCLLASFYSIHFLSTLTTWEQALLAYGIMLLLGVVQ